MIQSPRRSIHDDDDHDNDNDGVVDVVIEMTESSSSQQQQPVAVVQQHQVLPPPIVPSSSSHSSSGGGGIRNDGLNDTSRHITGLSTSSSSGSHTGTPNRSNHSNRGMKITTANETPTLPTVMKEKTRTFLHRFFYPHQHKQEYIGTTTTTNANTTANTTATTANTNNGSAKEAAVPSMSTLHPIQPSQLQSQVPNDNNNEYDNDHQPHLSVDPLQQSPPAFRNNNNGRNNNNNNNNNNNTIETKHTPNHDDELRQQYVPDMNDPDVKFVTNFWTTYDDILILSIFTQLGIVFRVAMAIWFKYFDDVFSNESALFVNLPLNCLSCFFMGLLCPGERLMETISTRFSPTETQQTIVSLSSTQQQQQLRPYRDNMIYNDDDEDDDDDEEDVYDERYNSAGSLNSRNSSNDGLVVRTNDLRQRRPNHQYHNEKNNRLNNLLRRRRPKRDKHKKKKRNEPRFVSWQPPVSLDAELRDVQLLALERRIRMSKCLVLFPVRKQDVDVMEHYFQQGYKRHGDNHDSHDNDSHENDDDNIGKFAIDDSSDDEIHGTTRRNTNALNPGVRPRRLDDSLTRSVDRPTNPPRPSTAIHSTQPYPNGSAVAATAGSTKQNNTIIVSPGDETEPTSPPTSAGTGDADVNADYMTDITDLANNIQDNVQENLYRLRRVNLADGWDTGTTASAMSDDLMLGLRDGFCGALSSFSSWNSAMVALLRKGQFTQALVGYMIGLQLPIVAYRFGQHVAVYIFIWRTRQETHKDERRGGYGIRLANHDDDDHDDDDIEQRKGDGEEDDSDEDDEEKKRKAAENEMPSLRAVITAIFIMALVTQCTSIFLYNSPIDQQIALSLLFSPLGVLARWRLTKLNRWKPTFPLGTFTCNILACALSGSLGDTEQVVLVSLVNGFGGTLSSLASFVVEILAGIDPILFRFDGVIYAAASIGCAMVVGFIFSASVEWADSFVSQTTAVVTPEDMDVVVNNITENLTRYW